MKKKAFTLVEVLFASGIFSMILVIGLSVVSMMSSSLYNGQIEETNRTEFNDIIFYLTREIQSAEMIKIEDEGKTLSIKQHGTDGYTVRYSFISDYPTGYMSFNNKRIIDIDYNESRFYFDNDRVNVEMSVVKNSIAPCQRGKKISLEIKPRCNVTLEE